MKIILIAIDVLDTKRDYSDLGSKVKHLGQDCHTFANVWMLRSEHKADEVYTYLKNHVIHPADRFVVAPLEQKWLAYNAPSSDDCYE